ncbi:MAG: hypothetical protein ACKO3K_01155 [Cuspidothrix sp.]
MKQPWGAVQINGALCAITCSVGLGMIAWGCTGNNLQAQNETWKIYKNPRYGFEFPYPKTWQELGNPDNSDGIALAATNQKTVEIRAHASKPLLTSAKPTVQSTYNFRTNQGFPGVMSIEVGDQVIVMKLTIIQGQLEHNWQGQSSSKEFPNYYRLFYYIAQEYKISQ